MKYKGDRRFFILDFLSCQVGKNIKICRGFFELTCYELSFHDQCVLKSLKNSFLTLGLHLSELASDNPEFYHPTCGSFQLGYH